jgi:MFS family permease
MGRRSQTWLLGISVGLVLADSSVVTIALPEILAQFDVEVATLAWALTSFNLALAVSALPAAFLARRRPGLVFGIGTVTFAAASLACAFASSFGVLVAGRTIQGVAGAAIVCAALDLLSGVMGADAPAARIWALAGVLGASLGPAAGGILTQALGWESIFVVQAPVALAALLMFTGPTLQQIVTKSGSALERPHVAANAALLLVSGALVAALFLLVILLINGWRIEPLAAGLVVTVIPLAAIAAMRYAGRVMPLWARAASGAILISGGLAALGWLPQAGAASTVPPQIAVGAGLGLALSALTERALAGRSAQAVHGGWTIAARHAGVVLGLVLLTPIFTTDLERNEDNALAAGTSAVLDSRISPLDKIGVARDVLVAVDEARDEARIPDVEAVVDRRDDPEYAELGSELQDQLDRAVTNAFSRSFLVAALLGLLALVPILIGRRDVSL